MPHVELKDVVHIVDLVMSDEGIKHKGKAIRKRLKELPGEDAEKVVRCKECRSYNKRYGECTRYGAHLGENGFCSSGIREEGAE